MVIGAGAAQRWDRAQGRPDTRRASDWRGPEQAHPAHVKVLLPLAPQTSRCVARLIGLMLLRLSAMTVNIEWQDQHGRWHHLQSKQNQTDAYRVAMQRAASTGKRHRLVDDSGRLLELLAA